MRAFEAYGKPLENVMVFKYMGWVMTEVDDHWPVVIDTIRKARKSWGRLSLILSQEGADQKVLGHVFKEVTQTVLLFRAETWY